MITNTHQRVIAADPAAVGALLDTLAGPDDGVWPGHAWPPMRFDRPLQVGAVGGHGDVRYTIEAYEPGRRVDFRFADGVGIDGTHWLEVEPHTSGGSVVRHVIQGRTTGAMRLLWPLAVRNLHDACLEDLLDRVEHSATGSVARPARYGVKTRLLRELFKRIERPRPADTAAAPGRPTDRAGV